MAWVSLIQGFFRHSIIPWSSLRLAPRIVLVTKRCRGSTGKSMIVVGLWLAWRRDNRRFAAVEVDFEVLNCFVKQASQQTADNFYFECSKFGSVFLFFGRICELMWETFLVLAKQKLSSSLRSSQLPNARSLSALVKKQLGSKIGGGVIEIVNCVCSL